MCPNCGSPLVIVELESVETDHCVACGGTWLDAGELELLLEGAVHRDEMLAGLTPGDGSTGEAARKCPICGKKMKKVECGIENRVLLDKCARGDGIWFDRGELREVIDQGGFPGENRIHRLLNDVFGGARTAGDSKGGE